MFDNWQAGAAAIVLGVAFLVGREGWERRKELVAEIRRFFLGGKEKKV